jgi:hypothetical protein
LKEGGGKKGIEQVVRTETRKEKEEEKGRKKKRRRMQKDRARG